MTTRNILVLTLSFLAACVSPTRKANVASKAIDTLVNQDGFIVIKERKDTTTAIQIFEKLSDYTSFKSYSCDTPTFTVVNQIIINKKNFKELTLKKHKNDLTLKEIESIYESDLANLQDEIDEQHGKSFANYYMIYSISCGSPCQRNIMIDLRNNNILEAPESAWGIEFKKNSYLIICNIGANEIKEGYYQINTARREVEFYLFDKNEFIRI